MERPAIRTGDTVSFIHYNGEYELTESVGTVQETFQTGFITVGIGNLEYLISSGNITGVWEA